MEVLDIVEELNSPGISTLTDAHVVTDSLVVGVLVDLAFTKDSPKYLYIVGRILSDALPPGEAPDEQLCLATQHAPVPEDLLIGHASDRNTIFVSVGSFASEGHASSLQQPCIESSVISRAEHEGLHT